MSNIEVAREGQKERRAEIILAIGNDGATACEIPGGDSRTSATPNALNDQGVVRHTRCEIDLAIQKYQEALSVCPDFADAQNNLGAAYYHRGDVDLAIRQWEQAAAMDATLAQTHHNLGIAHSTQGRLKSALEEWESALELEPRDADAYFGLGEIYEIWGDTEAALKSYQRFVDLAPLRDDFYVGVASERIQSIGEKARTGTGDYQETVSPGGMRLPLLLA